MSGCAPELRCGDPVAWIASPALPGVKGWSMADDPIQDLQNMQFEMGGVLMALLALVRSHPDPMGFATELRLMAGDLQIDAASTGHQMPEPTRQVLLSLLAEAEAGPASS